MATKTQGTLVSVETALAATKVITGATQASPCVITAVGHGYSNGDIVKVDNVVGMAQLNGRAFIVAGVTTDTFQLKGVDSTLYTAYVSAGDSYKATLTPVGLISGLPNLFTGTAPDIKTTHLQSLAEEKIQGLQDFGDATFDLFMKNTDPGQSAMRAKKEAQAEAVMTILLVDATKACFVGFVKSFVVAGQGNNVYTATSQVSVRAAPAWWA